MAENFLKNTFLSVLLCILFSCSIHTEEDVCIEQTPCLCKLNDDRYIDISHVITKDSPYLQASNKNLTYYFYPCKDVKFNPSTFNITVNNTTRDNCSKGIGTSLCLYNSGDQSLVNLGTTKDLKFSNDYYKSLVYTVSQPKNFTSTILLECAPDAPLSYLISSSYQSDQHQLILFSPHACIRFEHNSLSTGSTLLVMFSTVFGIYLLGGALILHFLRGARGKEMIPNLDFWVDLPCLVRLCLYNLADQSLVNLGTTKDLKFLNDYPKSLVYTVNLPKNLTSTILLQCAPKARLSYFFSSSYQSDQHQLMLFSSHACVRFEHNSLSTGSTLLVMFSTVFGIYLLGGALILYFLRGARGKEMIPNLDFWVDLPCLVRDGTVFLLNGCNPFSVSTAEMYERI